MERALGFSPLGGRWSGFQKGLFSWAQKGNAMVALFGLAFVESIFFPLPPDALLVLLGLAAPRRALRYALMCLGGSITGGMVGYFLGLKFWQLGQPLVSAYVSSHTFEQIRQYFVSYDAWAIAIAGFTPIPYKVFTLSAGFFRIDFSTFVIASALSRGARFFLVGGLLFLFGPIAETFIRRYFNLLSLALLVLVVLGFLVLPFVLR
ncbi:MAG: VTT domain-containing protein [Thermodesulfobacteriota bacterium]